MVQGAGGGANDLRSTLEEGHGVTARGSTGEPQKDDLHRMGPKPGARGFWDFLGGCSSAAHLML